MGKIPTVPLLKPILSSGMFENLPCAFCYHHFVDLNRASDFSLPGGGTFSSWCLQIWSNPVCYHTHLSDSGSADVDPASGSSQPERGAGLP